MDWDGPVTHRQFCAWNEWFKLQWNRPSRTDYHIMRLAHEVRVCAVQGNVSAPKDLKDEYGVKFSWTYQVGVMMTQEQIDAELARRAEINLCAGLGIQLNEFTQ